MLTLLLLLFTAGCIYIATTCVYRLFLHPFAHVPGPLPAKLTDAYGLYHAWLQDTHLAIYRLHIQYGAVGRIYDVLRFNPIPSVFNAIDKNTHRRKRRLVGQGFSKAALRASEGCILKHVDRFVDSLLSDDVSHKNDEWMASKDLSIHASYLALDIITDLVFGKSTDALVKPDHRQYRPMLVSTGHLMAMALQMPEAFRAGKSGQWLDLGTWTLGNLDNQRVQWAVLFRGWVLGRIQAEEEKAYDSEPSRRDMMSTIMNAIDPDTGEKLSPQEVIAEAYTLIIAGADTTATAISSTLFNLSRNPAAYERLLAEIRPRFQSLDDIRSRPVLSGCQYLLACIDEALRISAPVIAPLYREAGPGGVTVHGVYVPEGCVAASQAYALHHIEKHYPNSFSYRPERWLDFENGSVSASSDTKAAFFSFSHGIRNCVGINLAYLEISLAIARLLWSADFRIPSHHSLAKVGAGDRDDKEPLRRRENEYHLYDVFASAKKGPMLEFKQREPVG